MKVKLRVDHCTEVELQQLIDNNLEAIQRLKSAQAIARAAQRRKITMMMRQHSEVAGLLALKLKERADA